MYFLADYISAPRGSWPLKFLHAQQVDQCLLAHTRNRVGGPPKIFNSEYYKFGLKFSVLTFITLKGSGSNFMKLHRATCREVCMTTPTSHLNKDCSLLHPTIYLFLLDWTSRLRCRRRSHMERPAGRSHLHTISLYLQKTTKSASVSTLISCLVCVVLVAAACYLTRLKNFPIGWLSTLAMSSWLSSSEHEWTHDPLF